MKREIYSGEARRQARIYRKSYSGAGLSSYALRCGENRCEFQLQYREDEEEADEKCVVCSPAAADCEAERERGCRGGRPAGYKHTLTSRRQRAADLSAREDRHRRRRRKEKKKHLGQQNSEKTAKE